MTLRDDVASNARLSSTERTCKGCALSYMPTSNHQIYCSTACRPKQSRSIKDCGRCGLRPRVSRLFCTECLGICQRCNTSPAVPRNDRNTFQKYCLPCRQIVQLEQTYGITHEEWKALLDSQGGTCAACRTSEFGALGPVVDHDHTTSEIRGLLCNRCNVALGMALDDPQRLRALADYVEEHR